jgi:hypothetical protein
MVFSLWYAAEAKIGHLEIPTRKKESVTGQNKRQGNASTVFQLIWNCSRRIHSRRIKYKEAFAVYAIESVESTLTFHSRTTWCACTSLWACPRGADKTLGHHIAKPSTITSSQTMQFIFLSSLQRKAMWVYNSVSQGDNCCQKGCRTGLSYKFQQLYIHWKTFTVANSESVEERCNVRKCMWVSCKMVQQNHSPWNYWLQL